MSYDRLAELKKMMRTRSKVVEGLLDEDSIPSENLTGLGCSVELFDRGFYYGWFAKLEEQDGIA